MLESAVDGRHSEFAVERLLCPKQICPQALRLARELLDGSTYQLWLASRRATWRECIVRQANEFVNQCPFKPHH